MSLEESVENKRVSRVRAGFSAPGKVGRRYRSCFPAPQKVARQRRAGISALEKDTRSSGQDFRLPKKSPDHVARDFRLPKKAPDNVVQEFRLPKYPPEASSGISGSKKCGPTTSFVFFDSRKRRTIIAFCVKFSAQIQPAKSLGFHHEVTKHTKRATGKNPGAAMHPFMPSFIPQKPLARPSCLRALVRGKNPRSKARDATEHSAAGQSQTSSCHERQKPFPSHQCQPSRHH